jgi:orc1/cdc6 family replication initiation protein
VITNARVLQEDFVPADVEHRHEEISRLSSALEPLLGGEQPETPLLFGPTGVGKTCVARYTLGRLREQLLDLRTTYVNCWQYHSRFRVLLELLDEVGQTHDVHRQSTPHDALLDRLERHDDHPLVVVLDEVDQLDDSRLLYELLEVDHLHPVLVTNREADLFVGLDERVSSRLRASPRISFDRYGVDELAAILQARVDEGFEPGSVGRAELATVADAAAGDARVAIRILRSAARTAESAGRTRIDDDLVAEAIPEGRAAVRQRAVETLTPHQRVLYDVVEEAAEIAPGTLYDRYCERVSEPKSKRTVRKYLNKLDQYNLVRAVGEKRGRTYRRVAPE